MVELLYREDANTEHARAERYALVSMALPDGTFFLVQLHMWWDGEQNRLQRSEPVLQMIDAKEEAERIYHEQRSHLLGMGFNKVLQGHSHDNEPGITHVHIPQPMPASPGKNRASVKGKKLQGRKIRSSGASSLPRG